MIVYDNSLHKSIEEEHLENFRKISDLRIDELISDGNPNLLVFPGDLNKHGDKLYENQIISIRDKTIQTGNIMGFIGVNNSELTIKSRFAKDCSQDYFLHYMLQKVFCINMFDLKHSCDNENIFDFILYLFPYYLKKAINQGLFKNYERRDYNDANVRGRIDVNRHIRENIPFRGRISYSTREHSYDNHITQLIRHTIEHIKVHPLGAAILHSDPDTHTAISQIVYATPTYDRNCRASVMNQNIRPLHHPYFYEYRELQQLCMKILRCEGMKYGKKQDEVYGILFDGAWLWEEYLNTILKDCGFEHPENKTGKGRIYLFENSKEHCRYPDFYKKRVVLDAKYKKLSANIDRHDMHQVISYMHVLEADLGGFVFPVETDNDHKFEGVKELGKLHGYGGLVKLFGVSIPYCKNFEFKDFRQEMHSSERQLKDSVVFESNNS